MVLKITEEKVYKHVKIDEKTHTEAMGLFRKAGYFTLQEFATEGIKNWISFVKDELKERKRKEKGVVS